MLSCRNRTPINTVWIGFDVRTPTHGAQIARAHRGLRVFERIHTSSSARLEDAVEEKVPEVW